MTHTPSFRDVEKLSAYLDGQLKPSEKARLESRLQSDPELASILKDLRQTRNLLRQLPPRRAPRNFTLTPKMVGQKPPMPRSYPAFRFATVLATLLLFFTLATNFMAPRLVRTAAPFPYGVGGGGGGEPEEQMEAPAAGSAAPLESTAPEGLAAPTLAAPEALATAEAPSAADNTRISPTPEAFAKNGVQPAPTGETLSQQMPPEEPPRAHEPPVSAPVQIALAVIAALSALTAFILRYIAIHKWRAKIK
jgi:anti-sigma factor RsiW